MRLPCHSANQTARNTAIMIAIYFAAISPVSSHTAHQSHTSIAGGVAACLVLVAAVLAVLYLCRRQRTEA